MNYFWFLIFGFLLLLLCISVFNIFFAPKLNGTKKVESEIKVSVLIPARNEAHNISRCLNGLVRQSYQPLEIIVLDDNSEDNTAEIVRSFAESNSNVTLLHGEDLPEGWTGKNWACHQLSQVASGEILIFTDADNWHEPEAVFKTISLMRLKNLGLLSAFPQQTTRTFAEKLIVPMIDTILYSLLPLRFVEMFHATSLAAANGQWIAFTRHAYSSMGGHKSVRNAVVEDVDLARAAKQAGIKITTVAGTGMVHARMYRNFPEIWQGMTKILYGLTGSKVIMFWVIIFLVNSAMVLPYILVWVPGYMQLAGIAVLLNSIIRGGLAIRFRQPLFYAVLLHPISVLITAIISINSYRRYQMGSISWKGREIVPIPR